MSDFIPASRVRAGRSAAQLRRDLRRAGINSEIVRAAVRVAISGGCLRSDDWSLDDAHAAVIKFLAGHRTYGLGLVSDSGHPLAGYTPHRA